MNSFLQKITPNKARFIYDVAVTFLYFLFFIGILNIGFDIKPNIYSFLIPISFVSSNFILGLYGRRKKSGLRDKLIIILLSAIISSCFFITFFGSIFLLWVWLCFFLPLICLPRYFLNISNQKNVTSYILNQRGPVLIIGGAGYIGTHLIQVLLERGERVVVLDRLMYGPEPIEKFIGNSNFSFLNGDTTDISMLTTSMRGVSAVVHLAGLVGDPACAVDENFTRHTNIVATRMVKQVAESMGVHRLIFASSCSVYGVTDHEIDETGELNPVSLYARTKIDSEHELVKTVSDDFIVTILRFATVFGDSLRPRFDLVANLFTAQAMNGEDLTVMGPSQWRPFIHVHDLARAIALTLKADPKKIQNQVFNVGDERLNMTILELANTVQRVANKLGKYPNINIKELDIADRRNYAVSFKKIFNSLGFRASIMMEDGVHEMAMRSLSNEYGNYKAEKYSNVKITEIEKSYFYDPMTQANLYGPLQK
jgi:nucleoside-diphosphate-sugar epimerase